MHLPKGKGIPRSAATVGAKSSCTSNKQR